MKLCRRIEITSQNSRTHRLIWKYLHGDSFVEKMKKVQSARWHHGKMSREILARLSDEELQNLEYALYIDEEKM